MNLFYSLHIIENQYFGISGRNDRMVVKTKADVIYVAKWQKNVWKKGEMLMMYKYVDSHAYLTLLI